ncbi:unnamed protein product [Orchesella dallaii]|uniref:RGS domain-containing protein n=1 Tax=Orchesella dallaii TaxID=48710 RepID=A0ABP1S518_9HEXA
MRNENLELAQSSGSDSSPSWASATPKASTFNFDFAQSQTVDDLTSQFKAILRPSRSSEGLTEGSGGNVTIAEESKSGTSGDNSQYLYPSTSHSKSIEYGSGDHLESSCSSSGGGESSKKLGLGKESKIARFLRRTQSANDDHSVCMKPVGETSKEVAAQPQQHHLQKIDDSDEGRAAAAARKRNKFASVGTDMKFRLGFLKRRHTEGTIHSASVRPPPEEAQKWANSFNDLMASKYGQALFKAFLQREFSEENIEFWLAIEDYRKSRQNKLNTKAQKIYNDFIIPQAPKEVNLDALTKDSLVTKMAQPTHSTFDQAQKRIQGLLEADAYSRFLKSELYMELLHPERYQQSSP